MSVLTKVLTLLLIGSVLLLLAGCGSSKNPNPNNLTSAQASTLGTEVFTDVFTAISAAEGSDSSVARKSGLPALLNKNNSVRAPESSTLSYTYDCPDGGTIALSGSTGSGSVSITATPSGCNDGTLTFNGDPNITINGTGSDNGTTTTINITVGGGVSWTPDSGVSFPAGSCLSNMQIAASITDSTGALASCSLSGKFCGYSMNQSCMPTS
jgi:hypothetical protein